MCWYMPSRVFPCTPTGRGQLGKTDSEIDGFVIEALFSTVTNVNFDPKRLMDIISNAADIKAKAAKLYEDACASSGDTT